MRYAEMGEDHRLVHGFKNGKLDEISVVNSTDDMARADKVLVDFSVKKITELARSDKPFFLEHAFMKVHTDNYAHPDFKGMSASKYPFKDALCEVDMEIGMIVKALDEAGVLENTFIFVTSDNGPQMDGWPDAGYTPFRGAKGTTWEGGVHVPGIAYWKSMIKPGRVSDDVFDLMDLFNTCVHLAGADDKLPKDRYIDGVNQTSFLLHDEGLGNRECVFFWFKSDLMAVRLREYKSRVKVSRGIYHEGWFACAFGPSIPWDAPGSIPRLEVWDATRDVWELYDLSRDFTQADDLAAKEPARLGKLKKLFLAEAKANKALPIGGGLWTRLRPQDAIGSPYQAWRFDATTTRMPEFTTPGIGKRSNRVTIDLEIGEGASGVLYCLGGASAGVTVFMDQGHLV